MNWTNHPHIKFKNKGGTMGYQNNPKKPKNQTKNQNEMPPILTDDDINNILKLEENTKNIKVLIEKADELAKKFEYIPSSKLRDFYDYVVQIDESMSNNESDNNDNWYLKLMLLKPKMAYQASKENDKKKKPALKTLEREFSNILDAVKNDKNKFKNFKIFFEAVVAYHKKYAKSN